MIKNLEMEDGENAKTEWRKHKKLNGENTKNQFKKTQKTYGINIQRQTTQLLKLKILQKESIAEYLKKKNKSVSWKIKW